MHDEHGREVNCAKYAIGDVGQKLLSYVSI